MRCLLFIVSLWWCFSALAAEVMPPKPALYFNDYSGVLPAERAAELNRTLEDFERATSSQVVVAVFPMMQSVSSIEDYANRVFRAWGVGQKDKNNGVVLFVFIQDRKLRIEVGYGLEGVLPDALCKRIIEDEITPRFRANDYPGGLTAGVNAILAAAKGEYRGTGRTVAERRRNAGNTVPWVFVGFFGLLFILFVVTIIQAIRKAGQGMVYSGTGRHSRSSGWIWTTGGSAWSGGSSWGGGGFSSGGGFSGGGGSSGGGGASGSW